MLIREYEEKDFDDLAIIYNRAKPFEFLHEPFKPEVLPLEKDKDAQSLLADSKLYVCEIDGLVAFTGHIKDYITWLYVDPQWQRHGVGKKLLRFITQKAGPYARLNVAKSNLPALLLYTDMGFEVFEGGECIYQGELIHYVRMRINATRFHFERE